MLMSGSDRREEGHRDRSGGSSVRSSSARKKKLGRRKTDGGVFEEKFYFLQSVIDGIADPIIMIGTDFRVKLMNSAAREFTGERKSPAGRVRCHKLVFGLEKPCDSVGNACPFIKVIENGTPVTVEHEHTMPDGQTRIFEILASPLFGEDGGFIGIVETLRDVTDRKLEAEFLQKGHDFLEMRVQERTTELLKTNEDLNNAQEEILQAKEQAELLYRVVPSAIFTVDNNRHITSWNNKAESLTGYSGSEVLGKECSLFSREPCSERCGLFSEKSSKPVIGVECTIRTKDGNLLIINKNADLLHDGEGNIIGGIESFDDVTTRKEMDDLLRSERDKFKSMLSVMGQGVQILNGNYIIEYQNEILKNNFGEKVGRRCFEAYMGREEPCEVCRLAAAMETRMIQRTEVLMSDGKYYEQSCAPFRDIDGQNKVLILLRDRTEEKEHHAEIMRAGQLAAIGELAAGVAHEINNPINGIINYAQILLDSAGGSEALFRSGDDQDSHGEIFERIIREGERISQIVSNLLSFARQRDKEYEEVNVEKVVDDALALVRHQVMKNGIILDVDLEEGLPAVYVDPQQLQQIFLNLIRNGYYALNDRFPGKDDRKKLEITSRVVKIDSRDYVRTTIKDFGKGIPEAVKEHIFEPFFSTKEPGEGTGLGLSISKGLVEDFQGFINVESEEDSYTVMTVDLPVAVL